MMGTRGGYSLCDGWYMCAAVLTPFFHFGRIEHDLFGVFFSSTNSKAIFWGTKTTNFYKNRSFWPQIQFFPRSFWVQFSVASGTPHQFSGRVPPPPPPPPPGMGIPIQVRQNLYIDTTLNKSNSCWILYKQMGSIFHKLHWCQDPNVVMTKPTFISVQRN